MPNMNARRLLTLISLVIGPALLAQGPGTVDSTVLRPARVFDGHVTLRDVRLVMKAGLVVRGPAAPAALR